MEVINDNPFRSQKVHLQH